MIGITATVLFAHLLQNAGTGNNSPQEFSAITVTWLGCVPSLNVMNSKRMVEVLIIFYPLNHCCQKKIWGNASASPLLGGTQKGFSQRAYCVKAFLQMFAQFCANVGFSAGHFGRRTHHKKTQNRATIHKQRQKSSWISFILLCSSVDCKDFGQAINFGENKNKRGCPQLLFEIFPQCHPPAG